LFISFVFVVVAVVLVLVAVEMWQEARKQEKFIRGVMIDYKRRAERRKGFYDKIVITQKQTFL
jgi:hypothetical protein